MGKAKRPVTSMTIGIDPGSSRLGVAFVSGADAWFVSVEAKRSRAPLERLRHFADCLEVWFDEVTERWPAAVVTVAMEDLIPHGHSLAIARLAEVRGIVYSAVWRHEWPLQLVKVFEWKAFLSDGERRMAKDAEYVRWFNRTRGWTCRIPDEVDAALIAQAAMLRRKESVC